MRSDGELGSRMGPTHTRARARMHKRAHTRAHTCIYIHTHPHVHSAHRHTHTCTRTLAHTHAHTHTATHEDEAQCTINASTQGKQHGKERGTKMGGVNTLGLGGLRRHIHHIQHRTRHTPCLHISRQNACVYVQPLSKLVDMDTCKHTHTRTHTRIPRHACVM